MHPQPTHFGDVWKKSKKSCWNSNFIEISSHFVSNLARICGFWVHVDPKNYFFPKRRVISKIRPDQLIIITQSLSSSNGLFSDLTINENFSVKSVWKWAFFTHFYAVGGSFSKIHRIWANFNFFEKNPEIVCRWSTIVKYIVWDL